MGYARFFNDKYDRSGYLWQGKYKKVLVQKDAHSMYLPYYIHLNALDSTHKNWRNGSVYDLTAAIKTLGQYRWSSYLDYNDKPNFPSILYSQYLSETLGTEANQRKQICNIISTADLAEKSNEIEL